MQALIERGHDGLSQAQAAIDSAGEKARLSADDVVLKAPIPAPRDVMAVGRNYHEHAQEFHDSGFDATFSDGGAGRSHHFHKSYDKRMDH